MISAEQKLTRWAATQPKDNFVYTMACGHEHDSPFTRTEGVFVRCSAHGPQRLIEGTWTALPTPEV